MAFPWIGWGIAYLLPTSLIFFIFVAFLAPDIVRNLKHIADVAASAIN